MMPKSLWSLLVLFLVILDYTEGWFSRRPRVRLPCPVINCAVSAWTRYSPCSQPCGHGGTKKITRTVTHLAKFCGRCPYALVHIQPCNRGCPNGGIPVIGRCICKSGYFGRCCTGVDGGWSRWSVWKTCTKSCESGTQTRSRSCTQPPPQHGGRTCLGAARGQRVCNKQSCPVDGDWSNWTGWRPCSKSCGKGFKERFRSCTQPAPKFGGNKCTGEAQETHECNNHPCPVHGSWSVWSSWSSCAKTCGGGAKERTRSCTNPPPFHGGQGCGTQYYESKECAMKKCPVDGGWSVWSVWSSCSKSCGIGSQERSRSCTQPPPSAGGKTCPRKEEESRRCNSNPCPESAIPSQK